MNRLFPLPFFVFIKMVVNNRGISLSRLKNVFPWFLKTVVLEPFRWLELALYNRKIRRHQLAKDPVFILGFYRSGTSYLHEFITQDDRLGYHSNFQMVFPDMMLSCEKWLSPLFEFIFRTFRIVDPVHRTRLSFRFPGEEDGTMTTAGNPRGAAWGYFFPKRMMEYFHKYVLFQNVSSKEIEKWTQDYVYLLKKISLAAGGKQLVLKSPPNTARVKLLLSEFPNAKFIFIHRHPIQVYASNKRFLKIANAFYGLDKFKSVDLSSVVLDTYAQTMNHYLKERSLIPAGQLIEVAYEEFVKTPVRSMRTIYKTLHLDDFAYCENSMRAFAERQKNFVSIDHKLHDDEKHVVMTKLEPVLVHWHYSG